MNTSDTKTTLFLIPGGSELQLPENANRFKTILQTAIKERTAEIIMLANTVLIPEEVVQSRGKYKNVLLIESDSIVTTEDAWAAANYTLEGHLPVVYSAGFDYQVIAMEFVKVSYEDFERVAKFT
ncbi:hypothetical protein FMM05_14435 [Flavobacterium zepuense]|uniref:Uncharacterized protein n=1 Tax=Flavobacterium zepuense TaxID=2593302 RepID=A0A552UYR1_9FLAO|nr:hypothetical protein [Flavobacterium zepuense]TRW23386.1 hypothetical protein FMM05_14435 [Flavobacterium zepuense]